MLRKWNVFLEGKLVGTVDAANWWDAMEIAETKWGIGRVRITART